MHWRQEKKRWPNAALSRFVETSDMVWHVQQHDVPDKPMILMLHGSGATTHSFAGLFDALKDDFSIVMIDLPGHGFSSPIANKDPNLTNVCAAFETLFKQENIDPQIVVGHSAGAAIATHLAHLQIYKPNFITSINGAFFPFPGFAGHLFPAAAKLLFLNPFVPKMFAFTASEQSVARLLMSTGSRLLPAQLEFYRRAFQSSRHVEGTLAMMANWDLEPLANEIAKLNIPMLQIIGRRDGTIDPSASLKVEKLLKSGLRHVIKDAGHLVHEERPTEVAEQISSMFKQIENQEKSPQSNKIDKKDVKNNLRSIM